MKKLILFLATVLLVLAMLLPSCKAAPTAPETITWKLGTVSPALHPMSVTIREMADDIAERTGGRLQLEWHQYYELGFKGTELLDTFEAGTLEIGELIGTYLVGQEPMLAVSTLPFSSTLDQVPLVQRTLLPYTEETLDKHNIKILMSVSYPDGIWTKSPINTMDDVKKLKIRCHTMVAELMANVGGAAVTLPWPEIYTAIATGIIDGAVGCLICGLGSSWHEVAKYTYQSHVWNNVTGYMVINKDAFSSLPADVQKILVDTAKEFEPGMIDAINNPTPEQMEALNKAGVVIGDLNPEVASQLVEASKPVWDKWLKEHPETKSAVDALLSATGAGR